MKVSLCFIWMKLVTEVAINSETIYYPSGICSLIDCSIFLSVYTSSILLFAAFILSALYITEKYMIVVTFLMFLVSLLSFTLEESNGILNRSGLYTTVFLAQTFAYIRNNQSLKVERIQFPIQIIAGGYFLASISKLNQSGLNWIIEAPQAAIQMVKGFSYTYFDSGNISELDKGLKQADFVLKHEVLVKLLFAMSLVFETFAWLAVRNKISAFAIGVLLSGMHFGILYFMNIFIAAIFYPMIIFMVNPAYLLYLIIKWFYQLVKLGVQSSL